jgi:dUTP pyrophosphatase
MSQRSTYNIVDLAKSKGCAILKLAITSDVPLGFVEVVCESVKKHNSHVLTDEHPDSGFDLHVPDDVTFTIPNMTVFINHGIKCAMYCNDRPCAYQMFPRSSISKTPLILANHTGIIDAGYRGPLIAAIKYLPHGNSDYSVARNTRLVQVCHPSLIPIYVVICSVDELSSTTRGDEGFGSTGI